jgi:hypothetical protein
MRKILSLILLCVVMLGVAGGESKEDRDAGLARLVAENEKQEVIL